MRLLNFASVRYAILALITSVMGNQINIVSCNKYMHNIQVDSEDYVNKSPKWDYITVHDLA